MPRRPVKPVTKSDPVRRALRGLFQVGAVTLAIQGYNLFAPRPLTAEQTAWVTAFGTFLVSFAQNALEDAGAVPAMLKGAPAEPPVEDDLTRRELNALAAAVGGIHNELIDLRADRRPAEPPISTVQEHAPPRFLG